MENYVKMDDLGVPPLFRKPPYTKICWAILVSVSNVENVSKTPMRGALWMAVAQLLASNSYGQKVWAGRIWGSHLGQRKFDSYSLPIVL